MTEITLEHLSKRFDSLSEFVSSRFNYLNNLINENIDTAVKAVNHDKCAVQSLKTDILREKEIILNSKNEVKKDLALITKFIHDLGKLTYELEVFKPDPVEEKKKIAVLELQLEKANNKIASYEKKIKSILKD